MTNGALAPCSIGSRAELSEEYRGILLRLIAGQAYGELAAVKQYSRWIERAPGEDERRVVAAILQEEIEHWSGCIRLMEDLGVPAHEVTRYQVRQPIGGFAHMFIPRSQWSDAVMVAFLIDRAGYFMIEDYAQSSYAPWAKLARDILGEEQVHSETGQKFTADQIQKIGVAKMQRALRKWCPIALNSFGPDVSKYHDNCIRLGFKRKGNAERRARYRADLEPRIRVAGLEVPQLLRNTFPYI